MALKSPGSGQRARANPTEALIPDNLLDYRDPYDSRWRGDKPYIGLGNAVRNKITAGLRTSVRWMLPGDLLDWSGPLRWADAHFPGYDPDLDHGVYEEVGDAIFYLIKHGFLQRCNQENPGFIRTDKPPQVAYSVFGNGAVKYQLKRITAERCVGPRCRRSFIRVTCPYSNRRTAHERAIQLTCPIGSRPRCLRLFRSG